MILSLNLPGTRCPASLSFKPQPWRDPSSHTPGCGLLLLPHPQARGGAFLSSPERGTPLSAIPQARAAPLRAWSGRAVPLFCAPCQARTASLKECGRGGPWCSVAGIVRGRVSSRRRMGVSVFLAGASVAGRGRRDLRNWGGSDPEPRRWPPALASFVWALRRSPALSEGRRHRRSSRAGG